MSPLDERIVAGMRDQLALRRKRLRGGERPLGWKVGFGSSEAAAQLGIDRPLVGFLTDGALLYDGAAVNVRSWRNPKLEPEIAVHLARDLGPGASRDDVAAAIGGLSVAIELVDVHPPPTDVRAILACNIYHRNFMLGPVDSTRTTPEGIGGRVLRDGEETASNDDPARLTGDLLEVMRLTAELLAECGERLRAHEVVITGSVLDPLPLAPGHALVAELGPLGRLALTLEG